ncbi:MAG: hypothetical protein M3275_02015 [Thermoproteota archaeon]|nr:hypothetical protein [Thermoproteota archaeon]
MTNTTIVLKIATRDWLKQIGKKGQSYDEVIRDLIVEYNNSRNKGDSPGSAELGERRRH